MSETLTGITVDDLTKDVPEPIDGLPEFIWVYWVPSRGYHAAYVLKKPEEWVAATVEPSFRTTTVQGLAMASRRITPNDALEIAKKEGRVGVVVIYRDSMDAPIVAEIQV